MKICSLARIEFEEEVGFADQYGLTPGVIALPTDAMGSHLDDLSILFLFTRALIRHLAMIKYWEVIADKLSVAGFSSGYCSAVTPHG